MGGKPPFKCPGGERVRVFVNHPNVHSQPGDMACGGFLVHTIDLRNSEKGGSTEAGFRDIFLEEVGSKVSLKGWPSFGPMSVDRGG